MGVDCELGVEFCVYGVVVELFVLGMCGYVCCDDGVVCVIVCEV